MALLSLVSASALLKHARAFSPSSLRTDSAARALFSTNNGIPKKSSSSSLHSQFGTKSIWPASSNGTTLYTCTSSKSARFMTSTTTSSDVEEGPYYFTPTSISRLSTLQSLLAQCGAPGSALLKEDSTEPFFTPIAVDSTSTTPPVPNLHPHLFPIAQSTSNPNHYICALRRAYADDADCTSSTDAPWPIVEALVGGPGYNLLAMNSEHYMRRMAAEADFANESNNNEDSDEKAKAIVDLYNEGLGNASLPPSLAAMDTPYTTGSVSQLGYGCDKYTLLRIGPFPDLYQTMSNEHKELRNDESSSLIAAETCNSKFTGFGSTFAFYAKLLKSFGESRNEEARDAARMCLRLPLPSAGVTVSDFQKIASIAELTSDESDVEKCLTGLEDLYEKIRQHEQEENAGGGGPGSDSRANMTKEQLAIEDANYVLDRMVFVSNAEGDDFEGRNWENVRGELGKIYGDAGMEDMALFVDPSTGGSKNESGNTSSNDNIEGKDWE